MSWVTAMNLSRAVIAPPAGGQIYRGGCCITMQRDCAWARGGKKVGHAEARRRGAEGTSPRSSRLGVPIRPRLAVGLRPSAPERYHRQIVMPGLGPGIHESSAP